MKVRVLTQADSADWENTLTRLPKSDIYFTAALHAIYEANGDGKAMLFTAEKGDDLFVHPFFRRPIERVGNQPLDRPLYDIETIYGYSGPLATTDAPDFWQEAGQAFTAWCVEQGIVAEFVRFHPLLNNHRSAEVLYTVRHNRETVVVDLRVSSQERWDRYPQAHRNKIRKAEHLGLVCEMGDDWEGFQQLYTHTMRRLGAGDYYFFSSTYFEEIRSSPAVKLFTVRDQGLLIGVGVFFIYPPFMHYHLSGSSAEHRQKAPNNLMLHTAAEWGTTQGCEFLHLGGGTSNAPDDPLFRFKAGISTLHASFYIGTRVHLPDAYEQLCNLWMAQSNAPRPPYFLLYRARLEQA